MYFSRIFHVANEIFEKNQPLHFLSTIPFVQGEIEEERLDEALWNYLKETSFLELSVSMVFT